MNYDNFDTQEQESLIELHKTDYNNYADLSHFVDEYYKAQALIKECNNFYRSFLKSKLLPYSKIANSIYSQDKYKFYTYELSDGVNGSVCLTDECTAISELNLSSEYIKKLSHSFYNISIKGLSFLAASIASFRVAEEMFKDDPKFSLSFYGNDGRITPDKLIYKEDPRIRISLYGRLDMYKTDRESDYAFNERVKAAYKTLGFKDPDDLRTFTVPIRTKVDSKWYEYYKEEILRLFDKYDVCVYVTIKNKLMQDAKSCLYEYIGSHKAKKTIINQYSNYFSDDDTNKLLISIKEFADINSIKNVIEEYVVHEGIGHCGYGPENLIACIDKKKLDEYIKDQLSESTAVFRKILMTYEKENENQKLYIIDQHNEAQYFCDTKDLPNVHIELKGRELVCEYVAIHKFKKYTWPSDTPWTVVTDISTVIFNVSDNSVKSFKHTSSTHEEQVKYRR